MESKTIYFDKPGQDNTEEVLRLVKERASQLNIGNIVVASSRGNTAVRASIVLNGFKIIAVSHVAGFDIPGTQEFTEKNKKLLVKAGGTLVTASHAFAGLSRAMRIKHNMFLLGDIVADTLRIFGQGMKVCCEVCLMAADAGLIGPDEEVIVVGGTGRGADTAVVISPAYTHTFFDLKVKEIICKPR
jgi:uncharacterized protein